MSVRSHVRYACEVRPFTCVRSFGMNTQTFLLCHVLPQSGQERLLYKSTDNQDLSIAEGDNLLYDSDTLEPRETGQWLIAQNSAFCQCQHGPDGKIVFNLGQDTSENDSNQAKRLTSPSKNTSDLSNDSEDEVLLINTQNSCKGEGGDSPRWYSLRVGEILKKTTSLIRDKLATIINKLGFSD